MRQPPRNGRKEPWVRSAVVAVLILASAAGAAVLAFRAMLPPAYPLFTGRMTVTNAYGLGETSCEDPLGPCFEFYPEVESIRAANGSVTLRIRCRNQAEGLSRAFSLLYPVEILVPLESLPITGEVVRSDGAEGPVAWLLRQDDSLWPYTEPAFDLSKVDPFSEGLRHYALAIELGGTVRVRTSGGRLAELQIDLRSQEDVARDDGWALHAVEFLKAVVAGSGCPSRQLVELERLLGEQRAAAPATARGEFRLWWHRDWFL